MKTDNSSIRVRDLTKNFGNFTAVAGISFDVNQGEIFGFLGPNGSGKTTTIRMMLGLIKPTEGDIKILDIPISKDPASIRPRVGYMSQRFSLYNDLTVLQNLNFYGKIYGLDKNLLQERIAEALVLAGLEGKENATTKDLSGGWRQRLALSAAILHQPEILFLDEPTAGVDPVSRRAFWDLLYKQVAKNITVFVTTHYMDEAEHCHRLAFIQRGRIIAYGTPGDIKKETMQGQVLEIAPSNPIQTVAILKQLAENKTLPLDEIELYGSLVHVVGHNIENYKAAIAEKLEKEKIDPGPMTIIEPSLEDVFIACMR